MPLVRTERLLSMVQAPFPNDEMVRFPTACLYDNGEGGQELEVCVKTALQTREKQPAPPSPDFPLVLPGVTVSNGYECNVDLLAGTDGRAAVECVARFICNADVLRAGNGAVATSGRKRKLLSVSYTE